LTECLSSDDVWSSPLIKLPVDYTVDLITEFIKSQLAGDESTTTHHLRGPYLARLELMRLLRDRQDNRWSTVFGQFLRFN